MFGFTLFTSAKPTDRVFKYVNGRLRKEGQGLTLLCGPRTTVVSVPTTMQSIFFTFTELTSDSQQVTVQGQLDALYLPAMIRERHDFTVQPSTGRYLTDGPDKANDDATRLLQTYIRQEIAGRSLAQALASASDVQSRVSVRLRERTEAFAALGFQIQELYVTSVEPTNLDLKRALEAEARERMLASADRAVADRRKASAENDRQLQTYEAETNLLMEQKKSELIEVRTANQLAEAKARAESSQMELAVFEKADPRTLLAMGIREMGHGRIGQVNFTPEFMSLVTQAVAKKSDANGRGEG